MASPVRLSIGDFSRMTYLTVKTLRHYHDIHLLEPAEVDPSSGYRFYRPDQVPTAQVIRRFRDLGMPLDDVRSVLAAPDPETRNGLIVAHLDRMEAQLQQTQAAVTSLRALLEHPAAPITVLHRREPATLAVAVTGDVDLAGGGDWGLAALAELHELVAAAGQTPAGRDGTLFSAAFFEQGAGEVTMFVPVGRALEVGGRARLLEVPAAELACTVHQGPLTELDRTYGALGTYVAERELGVAGPIREYFRPDAGRPEGHETEVGWPVFATGPAG